MPVSRKAVTVQFQQGLDTESDEKTVPVGRLLTAENVIFDKRIGLYKRYGTDPLSQRLYMSMGYATVSGAAGIASRDDTRDLVMLTTDGRLVRRDDGGWTQMGPWVQVTTAMLPLQVRPWEAWDASTAVIGDRALDVWEDNRGGVWGQYRRSDGTPLSQQSFPIGGTGGRRPSIVAIGNAFVAAFTSGSVLYTASINVSNPIIPSVTLNMLVPVVSGSGLVGQVYDLCPFDNTTALLGVNASGSTFTMAFITQAGITAQSGSYPFKSGPGIPQSSPGAFGPVIAASPDLHGSAYAFTLSVAPSELFMNWLPLQSGSIGVGQVGYTLDSFNDSHSQVTKAACAFDPSITANGAYALQWVSEISASNAAPLANGPTNNYLRFGRMTFVPGQSPTVNTSGTLLQHARLASRVFQVNDVNYVWTTHDSPEQATSFLVRLNDGAIVAASNPGTAVPNVSGVLPNVSYDGANNMDLAFSTKELVPLPGTSGSAFGARYLQLNRLSFWETGSWRPVDVDGVLYMPGGWLGQYDGGSVTEVGFRLAVEGLTAVVGPGVSGTNGQGAGLWAGAGGTGDTTATWQYAVIPEWTNARGQRELGTCTAFPTIVASGSATTGSSVALTWPSITHTMKNGTNAPNITYGVYRSGPNGTVLQRVSDPGVAIVNNTASLTMSWTDTANEGFRASSELYYGTEEAPNILPASPSTITATGDRLYLADLEGAPYDWVPSKLRNGGAFAFALGAGGSFDSTDGPVTTLRSMDGRVIAFKANRSSELDATGPSNALGDSTPWPTPMSIVSDTGVPEYGTVVEIAGQVDQGLLYWSTKRGARLMDRSLSNTNVGWQVARYSDLTIVGGTAPRGRDETRLYSAEGTTLVYHTRFRDWSTIPGQAAVGACLWNGVPCYASPNGTVWVENSGSYLDGGAPYSMVIETGWIPLADSLQGLAKLYDVYVIGSYVNDFMLRVELAFNYRDSYVQRKEQGTSGSLRLSPYGGGGYGNVAYGSRDALPEFRIRSLVQRVQSMKVRIMDVDGSGQDLSLNEMKLIVGVLSSRPQLPGTKVQ